VRYDTLKGAKRIEAELGDEQTLLYRGQSQRLGPLASS
jgi:hypothetical protein